MIVVPGRYCNRFRISFVPAETSRTEIMRMLPGLRLGIYNDKASIVIVNTTDPDIVNGKWICSAKIREKLFDYIMHRIQDASIDGVEHGKIDLMLFDLYGGKKLK